MEEKEIQKEKAVKSDRKQTEILIGISLIIIAAIIMVIALCQPRVTSDVDSSKSIEQTNYNAVPQSSSVSVEQTIAALADDDNENIVINLNDCTAQDLMKLKGIGESKANAIIAYRNVIGSYSNTEEIKNISGISDKIYESIKDNITV